MRICIVMTVIVMTMISIAMPYQAAAQSKAKGGLLSSIQAQCAKLSAELDKAQTKLQKRLQRQEDKLWRKLVRKDSLLRTQRAAADSTIGSMGARADSAAREAGAAGQVYISKLDSLSCALAFMDKFGAPDPAIMKEVVAVRGELSKLQARLNNGAQLQRLIKERRKLLADQLQRFGMVKQLKGYQLSIAKYRQQTRDITSVINQPQMLGQKIISSLATVGAFRRFFSQHSVLAALFRMPNSPSELSNATLAGSLQTRASMAEQLLLRAGPGSSINEVLQTSQPEPKRIDFGALEKMSDPHGSQDVGELPPVATGGTRSKTFLQRLELGTNVQTARSSNFFPATSDLAVTVGYRISERTVLGIGAAYKLGLGKSFRQIQLSGQGAGLRAYGEWKIKNSFHATGGWEYNYQPVTAPDGAITTPDSWHKSGLVGISKTVQLSKAKSKATKFQLLWDFLGPSQIPKSSPIKFRVGYNF